MFESNAHNFILAMSFKISYFLELLSTNIFRHKTFSIEDSIACIHYPVSPTLTQINAALFYYYLTRRERNHLRPQIDQKSGFKGKAW